MWAGQDWGLGSYTALSPTTQVSLKIGLRTMLYPSMTGLKSLSDNDTPLPCLALLYSP